MQRNITREVLTQRKQLAMCRRSYEGYEAMRYYIVVRSLDVIKCGWYGTVDTFTGGCGYFVSIFFGRYDFFPIDEFNDFFLIVDNCEETSVCKQLNKCFSWLLKNKGINVKIHPSITDDGYFYSYYFEIFLPFTPHVFHEENHHSYELAAKKALQIVREQCYKRYAKEGIKTWLTFLIIK